MLLRIDKAGLPHRSKGRMSSSIAKITNFNARHGTRKLIAFGSNSWLNGDTLKARRRHAVDTMKEQRSYEVDTRYKHGQDRTFLAIKGLAAIGQALKHR